MEGGLLNIREEGWKAFKVGLVGEVLDRTPEAATERLVQTINPTYTAVLGDVTAFEPVLQAVVQTHGLADQSSLTADGAAWIWGIAERNFPESVHIVECYPAGQHLSAAAHALDPNDPTQAATWQHTRAADLFAGDVPIILQHLEKAGLSDAQHFFQTQQARRQYATFREAGYPIGSGSVQSEVKQFKARLTGPGMRWSRPAAERMLIIRAAVLDASFDTRWSRAA
jgi:hypothetical protein